MGLPILHYFSYLGHIFQTDVIKYTNIHKNIVTHVVSFHLLLTFLFKCRLQRTFNKKSGRWTVYPVKGKKTYHYIEMIMEWILEKRLEDKEGFHKKQDLEEGDPRRLAGIIALVPPPPTAELAAETKSRFDQNS